VDEGVDEVVELMATVEREVVRVCVCVFVYTSGFYVRVGLEQKDQSMSKMGDP